MYLVLQRTGGKEKMRDEVQRLKERMIGKLYMKSTYHDENIVTLKEAVNILEEFQMEIEAMMVERGIK